MCCRLFARHFGFANVYTLPPFSDEVNQLFMKFLADILPLPVLLVGDFNNVFNIKRDRFPPPKQVDAELLTPLGELRMHDLWCRLHPLESQYTCYSRTYNSLSHINLMLGSFEILRYIVSIDILARDVSDYSLLLATPGGFAIGTKRATWKLNTFWLQTITNHDSNY